MNRNDTYAVALILLAMAILVFVATMSPAGGAEPAADPVPLSENVKFQDYRARLAERRIYALETRRRMNAGRRHVYHLSSIPMVYPIVWAVPRRSYRQYSPRSSYRNFCR